MAPGLEIVITPPYAHAQVEVLFSAGAPPTCTVGEPGVHGAAVTGMHAPGVNTPKAAEV